MAPSDSFKPRKSPRQERARHTVDAILDTVAHILSADPLADFDTNAVAVRAGVSIGSVYQYFPNKGAILRALAERQVAHKVAGIREVLDATAALPAVDRIERCVDWMIEDKRRGAALERALVLNFHRYGDPLAIAALDAPLVDALAQALPATDGRAPPRLRAFVLLQAMRGAILATSLVHPAAVDDGTLRTELIALARGYLSGYRPAR